MEKREIHELLKQHESNYRKAILDNIQNNTLVLVDQDIMSLLKKPPLDSMDLIRVKFLDLAKKNKIVLNTEQLSILLEEYRNYLMSCCEEIKNIRILELSNKVEKTVLKKDHDIIKINKKDFVSINKKIKNLLKDKLLEGYQVCILEKIDSIYIDSVDSTIKDKIIDDLSKYMKSYQKQLLESFDIKIMVKDTTLMNGTKEQGERYLFTLNNSRLLNDFDS